MSDEPRAFVDTNVFIYANDDSASAKQGTAKTLLATIWRSGTGVTSIQVLQELYVNLVSKVRRPTDGSAAIVRELTHWPTHSPSADDVLAAIRLHDRAQISFWDAMILRSAARMGCTTVWSEDLNDGQTYAGVTVRNPFTA